MRYLLTAALALTATVYGATSQVGKPARELTIVESTGKQTLLTSLKGKPVLIQFLYTSCTHCQALSKELSKLQTEFGSKVQFVGIAFDEATAAKAGAYSKTFATTFPVGYASRDTVQGYLGLSVMDRFVVPQVMIIDKKGVVRAQSDPMGTAQLQDPTYLRKFLNELASEGASKSSSTKAAPKTTASVKK